MADDLDDEAAGDGSVVGGKQMPRRAVRMLVVGLRVMWAVLGVAGFVVGHSSVAGGRALIAGIVGAVFGSVVWVIFCWVTAFVLRGALRRRGYDVTPHQPRTRPTH